MNKHGLTDDDLDRIAEPYESGDYAHEPGEVFIGSHLDVVGKKRVTVIYDVRDTLRVEDIAKNRGVKPSEIYREALGLYLAAHTS